MKNFKPLRIEEILNDIDLKSRGVKYPGPTGRREAFINNLDGNGQIAAVKMMNDKKTSEAAKQVFLSNAPAFVPLTIESIMNSIDQKRGCKNYDFMEVYGSQN